MSDKRYRQLPDIVHALLVKEQALLVGSGAWWYVDGSPASDTPRDYDIITTEAMYPEALRRLRSAGGDVEINGMGGTKVTVGDDLEIDIWPQRLSTYLEIATKMGFRPVAVVGLNPKIELVESSNTVQ